MTKDTTKPKKGRPQVDTEAVNVRILASTLHKIDEWRATLRPLPSRPEAIRRLIEIGLALTKNSDQQ